MSAVLHPFLQKVEAFIARHHLLVPGGRYLVALSGGADSVALLVALRQLGYDVACVHCNFHLRGEESNRDEEFCRSLCEDLGVGFHTAHFATAEYAQAHHVSIEMAARELRYHYFERLRTDIGADDVAVAHHQDDAAETLLLNLIRGTGIHGLTGIAPRNGHIIRPLLAVQRGEVEAFLRDGQWSYVTDSTNLVADVVRNKIRLQILPLMRDINPSVTDALTTTAARLSQVATVFDEAMAQREELLRQPTGVTHRVAYDRHGITDEYTLYYILSRYGFSPAAIEEVFSHLDGAQVGSLFASATHELLIDRDQLLIQPLDEQQTIVRLPIEGKYIVGDHALRITKRVVDGHFSISRSPDVACLDAATLSFPFTLRTLAAGDRFCPLGMSGSRLVSDFLTDLKVNRFDKRRQLVLTDANDRIAWVVGRRPDHRFRITSLTHEALIVEFEKNN